MPDCCLFLSVIGLSRRGTAGVVGRAMRLRHWLLTLYGPLPPAKLADGAFHSLIFFFVVGTYWQLRSLKTSVFAATVGLDSLPFAKLMSVVVVSSLLVPYGMAVDFVRPRYRLLGVLCGSYATVFVLLAISLFGSSMGVGTSAPSKLVGWLTFFSIESYGSIVVSCFWQHINSRSSFHDARAVYGLIVAGGQVGQFVFSTLVASSRTIGVPLNILIGGICSFSPVALMAAWSARGHRLGPPAHLLEGNGTRAADADADGADIDGGGDGEDSGGGGGEDGGGGGGRSRRRRGGGFGRVGGDGDPDGMGSSRRGHSSLP